jgi:hypothetical protein
MFSLHNGRSRDVVVDTLGQRLAASGIVSDAFFMSYKVTNARRQPLDKRSPWKK